MYQKLCASILHPDGDGHRQDTRGSGAAPGLQHRAVLGRRRGSYGGEESLGVAQLLKQMPNLEALDLRQRSTLPGQSLPTPGSSLPSRKMFRLPSLEQCFLRDVPATEASLLRFLADHPNLEHLELHHVRRLVRRRLGARTEALGSDALAHAIMACQLV